jgi:hypothetical protein
MAAFVAAVFLLVVPQQAPSRRELPLGHGFTAVAFTRNRVPGGAVAIRTLEIRRGGKLLKRFRSRYDEGLGIQAVDITGDGVHDLLVLNYRDGSGACGTYRLYAGPEFRELWVRSECADTGVVRIVHGDLIAWTAVLTSKTASSGTYPHCCWRIWRKTSWRWAEGRLRIAATRLTQPPTSWQERLLPGALWIR